LVLAPIGTATNTDAPEFPGDTWLDGAAGTELLVPAVNDLLQAWPVSTRVNTVDPVEDSSLIERVKVV